MPAGTSVRRAATGHVPARAFVAGALGALGALVAFGAGSGAAQETEGGFQTALTVSPQLVLSSEAEGLGFRTGFALALSDATRNQSIRLEAASAFEQALGGNGEEFDGFQTPALRFAYDYETRGTAIGLDATYSSSDVDDSFVDPLTGLLILDEGERTAFGLGTTIAFGRDAPFGGTFTARRDFVDYTGTTDPRLEDGVTDRAALSLAFRVDPRIDVTLGANYLDTRADGFGTDRRITGLSAGVALAVTQSLTATAAISYDRTETSGSRPREVEDGIGVALGAVLDRPNGTITAQAASRVTENGRRTRLDFGRSLVLPRGELSVGLGLQESASGGFDPLYSLSYAQDLPRGRLTAAAQQTYLTDIEGDEAISTTVTLGYARELTPIDQVTTRFVLQNSAVQTGTGTDARRAELGVTYNRLLAQDWSLVAGASYERDDREGRDTDTDGEVFLGLEKTFLWRD